MPKFVIFPAHSADGNPAEFVVNLDQITRVAVTGPQGSIERIQVFLSDGHHFTLKEKAARDFFEVIKQPEHNAGLPRGS
jgi:hypothetical protein